MKRFLIVSLICLTAVSAVFAQKKGDVMWVAVKNVKVKSSTGWFASTAGTLTYGTQVTVQSVSGKKVQIQGGGVTGWVDVSALTSKRITASASATSASAKEIALAGKGFSEEIEGTYRSDNKNLDAAYKIVDTVEATTVSDDVLQKFIVDGDLIGAEGATK
jgi:uncharacterized protein YgiM (DUF1202 family)